MKKLITIAAIAAATFTATPAEAGPSHKRPNKVVKVVKVRPAPVVVRTAPRAVRANTGRLTAAEQRYIDAERREINAYERRAKSDGWYGLLERWAVNGMENELARDISRMRASPGTTI